MRSTPWILILGLMASTTTAWSADYTIDNGHSVTLFKVHHLGAGYIHGAMPEVSGKVSFDPANVAKNSINVTVKTASITTFNGRRDTHLKSPDFFDVKQFSNLSFKSDSWKSAGKGTYEISGKFTMLGISKPITIQARHTGFGKQRGKDLAGFEATFTIDRTDFGMKYGVASTGGLGKDVTITVALECTKD